MRDPLKSNCLHRLFALLGGASLVLAFAPFGLWPMAIISPALWLYTLLNTSPKQALLRGFLFGLGFFGTGVYWVFISIHVYGNANFFVASLITALMILALALYPATCAYVFRKLFAKTSLVIQAFCVFPALWVLWECLRSWLLTGFPWLLLGYSQTNSLFASLAPVFGTYGLSWCCVLISGALVVLCLDQKRWNKFIAVLIILFITLGALLLSQFAWTTPKNSPIKVSLVQGNIDQKDKWDINHRYSILNIYTTLTAAHWESDLIVWPEAAIPALAQSLYPFLPHLAKTAKTHDTAILTGILSYEPIQEKYFNSLLLLGNANGTYHKRLLVPFGEYMPLRTLLSPLFNYVDIPQSDFTSGNKKQTPLVFDKASIAPFICYEIAYPQAVLRSSTGSELLITITDDSWFGESIALNQHLQIAQFRSLEMGRYSLFSSNTGISAIIDPNGKLMKSLGAGQRGVITADIKPMIGKTPLMKWGYYPLAVILGLLLLLGVIRRNKNPQA